MPSSNDHKDVIAHRGYHNNTTGPYENTLEAMRAAVTLGADRLELDVQRTRDGVLVVHHDNDVNGHEIAKMDYAALPLLPGGFRIPTLASVVDLARTSGAQLDVEIKEGGYETEIVDALAGHLPTSQFHIISFESDSLAAVEAYRSDVVTGVLAPRVPEWLRESFAWPFLERVFDSIASPTKRAQEVGADYISVDHRSATDTVLNAAKQAGLGVNVWTVDDRSSLAMLLHDPRIDGVVTNRPDIAMQLRDQASLGASSLR